MGQDTKTKKPFYKKWYVWVLAALILFILWPNPKQSTETSNNNKSTKSTTKQEQNKIIKVGEEASVGNLGIKIIESIEKDAISNEAGKSTPSGKFIVVKLQIKNNGQEATEYDTYDFKLKNKDVSYQIDDNAFEALGYLNSQEKIYNNNENFVGVYDKFNAGITKNTYIVFDVPKEAKLEDLKLVIKQNKKLEFNLK